MCFFSVVCQINPAMLALMSQGGAGGMAGSPLALAGMGMGNEMADLMMLQVSVIFNNNTHK